MAVKIFLVFATLLAFVEFLAASPTRRQYVGITEATASDSPVTNDGTEWDDNDEFDLDGEGWFSQAPVSPSPVPEKAHEYNEYDEDYSRGNVMVEFGDDDDEQEDADGEHLEQDAEEEDNTKNDSEFLFVPPKDTRLVLEDDDDDQSGPIKVRHTGRSSYPKVSDGADNSLESSDEDKDDNEHPYEFTIDEDDKEEDDDEEEDTHKDDDSSVEVLPRHEAHEDDDDDDDEFVSESDDSDMFDNPEEEAAQVIYGDHVFLY